MFPVGLLKFSLCFKLNLKHRQTQTPTASVYSSSVMSTLAFQFGSKLFFLSQSDCPAYHALSWQSSTREHKLDYFINEIETKYVLKAFPNDEHIGHTQVPFEVPLSNTNSGGIRLSNNSSALWNYYCLCWTMLMKTWLKRTLFYSPHTFKNKTWMTKLSEIPICTTN